MPPVTYKLTAVEFFQQDVQSIAATIADWLTKHSPDIDAGRVQIGTILMYPNHNYWVGRIDYTGVTT